MSDEYIEVVGQVAAINIPDTQNEVRQIGNHLSLMIYDAEMLPNECDERTALKSAIKAIETQANRLAKFLQDEYL